MRISKHAKYAITNKQLMIFKKTCFRQTSRVFRLYPSIVKKRVRSFKIKDWPVQAPHWCSVDESKIEIRPSVHGMVPV